MEPMEATLADAHSDPTGAVGDEHASGESADVGGEDLLERRITARELLVTFIGYYWRNRLDVEAPGVFLVSLMSDFGVSPANTRVTLRRLEREGLLDSRKSGRNVYFRASAQARERAEDGARRILNLGVHDDWDGVWTMVAFSIPEELSHVRMALRDSLRVSGFAPFYDGVWIAPGDLREIAIAKAELRGVAQFSAHLVEDATFMVRGRAPIDSWDLDAINHGYEVLIDEADAALEAYRAGELTPGMAMQRRTHLLTRFRRIAPRDPGLPAELMPEQWLRSEARRRVVAAFDELGDLAALRTDAALAGVDEPWAERLRRMARMTFEDLAAATIPHE